MQGNKRINFYQYWVLHNVKWKCQLGSTSPCETIPNPKGCSPLPVTIGLLWLLWLWYHAISFVWWYSMLVWRVWKHPALSCTSFVAITIILLLAQLLSFWLRLWLKSLLQLKHLSQPPRVLSLGFLSFSCMLQYLLCPSLELASLVFVQLIVVVFWAVF